MPLTLRTLSVICDIVKKFLSWLKIKYIGCLYGQFYGRTCPIWKLDVSDFEIGRVRWFLWACKGTKYICDVQGNRCKKFTWTRAGEEGWWMRAEGWGRDALPFGAGENASGVQGNNHEGNVAQGEGRANCRATIMRGMWCRGKVGVLCLNRVIRIEYLSEND